MNLKYTVDKETSGKTVKHILKKQLKLSERLIKKLKRQGKILCNNRPVYVNAVVCENDIIEVDLDFDDSGIFIQPEDIPIDIIYEDEFLIALNKQPGIVVHPTCSHPGGTLANAVAFHLQKKGIVKKIRPVIRLDRDTSGIIIFAKNPYCQEFLIRQMNDKTFIKEYIGIVHKVLENDNGTIDLPIARKPGSIMLRHISPDGDPAVTHYTVLERLNGATLVKFRLETGRTHQIRVHCQAIGHPLLGDTLYPFEDTPYSLSGNNPHITQANTPSITSGIITRQALHSQRAVFLHPFTKKILEITAPIPEDMKSALEILRK
ncbi:MAG TPA: RluA family pseudouridine synthase [Hungateiclostridium thermocellum]|uniref:Pseudouridine synthase n=2 Tax=Acetivibrio thermocellus TaxID=1515 RepID=A3DDK9_ACET2|nr:RluA family pseudouridine synthase [Acetivibrio thermocellus]CDG35497.1 RluA family pseudouridine synthase [Acetivibrio thermocellus BC1]ABN52038.1 pseudouridine synthase, RluA family [Acetivibrio thermocellus ATCC 27405]ADU74480.1 pseudouridine synthase, RluA family [Acetivibrio thermocellus DSM 1313]ALX08423.1 pseudouridine synthase, RluA family [Acetivibrio thermocellus AD2]ANV76172.1 pseudouridine synthase, RluA family [Acetivibrio thermocellus DSM 2360]